ncbi:Cyclic Nucleotide-Binding Domain-Containing Protein 1 [Manis pentadactyla]|nr:Cyclic Nucleotide-Binding Domain-Containing Protein 1 [Manis pentadactyla]
MGMAESNNRPECLGDAELSGTDPGWGRTGDAQEDESRKGGNTRMLTESLRTALIPELRATSNLPPRPLHPQIRKARRTEKRPDAEEGVIKHFSTAKLIRKYSRSSEDKNEWECQGTAVEEVSKARPCLDVTDVADARTAVSLRGARSQAARGT